MVYENTKIIAKKEAEKEGFPYFLQATDLDTPFINTSSLFHVNNGDWLRYPKGRIKKGEILIEVKGKIDKVSIVPDDFPQKTLVSGSLFKLSVNNEISKNVLLCYLICSYGVAFKDRFKTNLLISYVSKPDLYRIPVPSFSDSFQQKVDKIFNVIFESKKISSKIYQQAEKILLKEVGLDTFEPSKEAVNIKSFKNSFGVTGRLDAEYYQLKYEDVITKVIEQNHDKLINLVSIKKSMEPGSANYSDAGLPFMRVADYDKSGLTEPNKKVSFDFVSEYADKIKKLKPKKGTILFSKDGSVGTAYHLRKDFNGITSSAILHLSIKDKTKVLPEYLTLALNSKVVKMQAERDAGGSIILHWRVGEIENVVVPIIDYDKQIQIAKLVEESFKLKKQSEHLLEVAKTAVEIAIEQNEKKAMEYINSNTN
ncbi:restriction endonuclease subunit S [Algibacter agarivorans]|uniref:restriction endonuclease subunit S n=1 Tax=Algibacter agarivorans TaxID=1109741 RepID=UPI0031ECCEAA